MRDADNKARREWSEPMRHLGKKEWQKNLIAMGIVAAVLVVFGFLLYRPALVIGVNAHRLSNSLSRTLGRGVGRCVEEKGGRWRCTAFDTGAYGQPLGAVSAYQVDTHGMLGCWTAQRLPVASSRQEAVSGCIDVFDLVGRSGRHGRAGDD